MKLCKYCEINPTSRNRTNFCSITCANLYRNYYLPKALEEHYINNLKKDYEQNPKLCKNCKKPFDFGVNNKIFCNRSCAASYNNTRKPPRSKASRKRTSKSCLGRVLSKASTAKRIKSFKETWKKRRGGDPERFCAQCNLLLKTRYRKTCSTKCHKLLLSNNAIERQDIGSGNRGYYQGLYCQSTWELAFVIYKIDKGLDVKRSPLRIRYKFQNSFHLYNPDFLIGRTTYEIKGYTNKRVERKTKAALRAGIKLKIIDNTKIQKYIKYVNKTYDVNILKDYGLFYD